MYVIGDERDLIRLRTEIRRDPVYLYPIRFGSPENARRLLVDMLTRAMTLREKPEFYNTLTNSCSVNLAKHANAIAANRVPWSYRVSRGESAKSSGRADASLDAYVDPTHIVGSDRLHLLPRSAGHGQREGILMMPYRTSFLLRIAGCILMAYELSAAVPFRREWAEAWNLGSPNGDHGQSIATDSAGNVYVAGSDGSAFHLGKYSPTGTQLWSQTAITAGPLFVGGFIDAYVVVDPSDNPILAGTMNAQDGTSLDYFVVKFDPSGTQLWLRRFDANNDIDNLSAIAVDEAGNIYAHGQGNGSGPSNVYTVKYDRDGTRLWVASYTPRDDLGCDVAVHSDGSVYALVSTTDYGTDDDIILIKYSASGTQLWLRRYNGGGESGWTDDWPSRLKLDAAGNAYLVGYSEPSNGGGYGLVTQKYLADGTLAWTRRYDAGGPSSGDFGYQPAGLALDDSGQVYVSGQIPNHSAGSSGVDAVTIKYAPDGTQLWSSTYDGGSNGPDEPRDLVLTPDGSVFVLVRSRTGQYYGDERVLLLQYDIDGILLSAEVDSDSVEGFMLARWEGSIYFVGTSTYWTGGDVTVRKYSPPSPRRRPVRRP